MCCNQMFKIYTISFLLRSWKLNKIVRTSILWITSEEALTRASKNSKLKLGNAIDSTGLSMFTNLIMSYDAFSLCHVDIGVSK